jgi:hypothetical protein
MNSGPSFMAIIRFALSQKTWNMRLSYLLKGFVFAPFILKLFVSNQPSAVDNAGAVSDDIYPLF